MWYEERSRKFYVDTASTAAWNQAVKVTAEVFRVDRMTFGSDFPLEFKTPEELAEILSAIYRIGLSDEEVRMVESETARKLLALAKVGGYRAQPITEPKRQLWAWVARPSSG